MNPIVVLSLIILIVSAIFAIVEFYHIKKKDQEIKLLSDSNISKDQALKEAKETTDRLSNRLKQSMIKNIIIGRNLTELDFILSEAKKRLQPKLWNRHFIGIESLNQKFEADLKNPEEALKQPEFKVPAPKIKLEDWIKENFRVPVEDDPIGSFVELTNAQIIERLQKDFPNFNVNNSSVVSELIRSMLKSGFKRREIPIQGNIKNAWKVVPVNVEQLVEK